MDLIDKESDNREKMLNSFPKGDEKVVKCPKETYPVTISQLLIPRVLYISLEKEDNKEPIECNCVHPKAPFYGVKGKGKQI